MCGAFTLFKQKKRNQSDAQVSTEYGYFKGEHLKLQTLVAVGDSFVRVKRGIQGVK